MLLERQGKLRLDDAIQTYLPEYPTHGHHVTLTHLLTHTSGISNFVTNRGFWEQPSLVAGSIDEVIALFKDLPFDFEPGTQYGYSNSGYVLLGHILERLLDMSYAEVKHAAGGLGTTLEDMIRWDATLREQRLLDQGTLERMYAPVQLVDGRKENYGLGWVLGHYRGHDVLCHGGGVPGFSAFFGRFLADGVTIIVLSNQGDFNAFGLAGDISYLVLDGPSLTRTSISLDPEMSRKVIGTYRERLGALEVREEEQTLYLSDQTAHHRLVPMNETSFYWAEDEDVEVHFENPNEQGIYERLRVIWPFAWFTAERSEGERDV